MLNRKYVACFLCAAGIGQYSRYALRREVIRINILPYATCLAKKQAEGKRYNVVLSHSAKKLVRLIFVLGMSALPRSPTV